MALCYNIGDKARDLDSKLDQLNDSVDFMKEDLSSVNQQINLYFLRKGQQRITESIAQRIPKKP